MLTLTLDAVFEQGAFRLLKPFSEIPIPEGHHVRWNCQMKFCN